MESPEVVNVAIRKSFLPIFDSTVNDILEETPTRKAYTLSAEAQIGSKGFFVRRDSAEKVSDFAQRK